MGWKCGVVGLLSSVSEENLVVIKGVSEKGAHYLSIFVIQYIARSGPLFSDRTVGPSHAYLFQILYVPHLPATMQSWFPRTS